MVINSGTVSRAILIVLAIVMIILVFLPLREANKYRGRESVVHETLQCVSAVCVEDRMIGRSCSVISPVVSKVLITIDPDNPQLRIVRVEQTNADCG